MPYSFRTLHGAALAAETAHVFRCQRQQGEMPRPFDGERQFALMARAGANLAAWANLAAVGQVAAQLVAVFVINNFVLVFAVNADSARRRRKAALSAAFSALSAVSTGTAIRARTAWTARAAA